MENEKQVKRRLLTLAQCADVLDALRDEMPQAAVLIGQAKRQVDCVRELYVEQRRTLDELAQSERKPPQRVPMHARRKPATHVTATDRTTPTAPLDSMHVTRVINEENEG
jgi:hypothetical protein